MKREKEAAIVYATSTRVAVTSGVAVLVCVAAEAVWVVVVAQVVGVGVEAFGVE